MKSNQKYLKIGKCANSLILRLTEQLKELKLKEGDTVYTCVEDGRIIIERVSK